MALLIAVGFGFGPLSDPFTCCCDSAVAFDKPGEALAFICGVQTLKAEYVDEIFVIDTVDDQPKVVQHWSAEHSPEPTAAGIAAAIVSPISVVGHLTKQQRAELYKEAAQTDEVSSGNDEPKEP